MVAKRLQRAAWPVVFCVGLLLASSVADAAQQIRPRPKLRQTNYTELERTEPERMEPTQAEPISVEKASGRAADTDSRDLVKPTSAADEESLDLLGEPLDAYGDAYCDCGECDVCTGDCYDDCYGGYCTRLWFQADALIWWHKAVKLPPLLTTGPSSDGDYAGVLGRPDTQIVVGDEFLFNDNRSDFRFTLGYWFDCCETFAVAADYFGTGQRDRTFSYTSTGDPVLTRPYYDVLNDLPAVQRIAFPGTHLGCVDIRATDEFNSAGFYFRKNAWCFDGQCEETYCESDCGEYDDCGGEYCDAECDIGYGCGFVRVDWMAGYRYYGLNDSVQIGETFVLTQPDGGLPAGTAFQLEDSFRTTNDFHGAELGLITKMCRGRWSLELLSKMALGTNRQMTMISGSTAVTQPGQSTVNYDGGFLALDSNIGRYTRKEFVVIPQFGAELAYDVTCNVRFHVGYNYIYWAHVARSADQIDLGINTDYLPPVTGTPTPVRPAYESKQTNFYAHGINLGLSVTY